MPRPSFQSLTVAPVVDVARLRLMPRPGIPPEVGRVFAELVASVGPAHFRESDRVLLEELAQAVAIAREASQALAEQGLLVAGEVNGLVKVISTQGRLVASLATRCRLTPQSRVSKDKAGTTTQEGLPPGLAAGFAFVQRARHE